MALLLRLKCHLHNGTLLSGLDKIAFSIIVKEVTKVNHQNGGMVTAAELPEFSQKRHYQVKNVSYFPKNANLIDLMRSYRIKNSLFRIG